MRTREHRRLTSRSRSVNPTEGRWREFGRALSDALARSRKTQTAVAQAIGVSTSTISDWKLGKSEPERPAVTFALEHELGVGPGELSKYLGYVPREAAAQSWQAALLHDPEIDDRLREVLLAVIRAMEAK